MSISFFDWHVWMIAAFMLGAIDFMLGTVILGGMGIGALGTAAFVAVFGAHMADMIGPDWALPLVVWAILSLIGTSIVTALFRRTNRAGIDINDAPYKGDDD